METLNSEKEEPRSPASPAIRTKIHKAISSFEILQEKYIEVIAARNNFPDLGMKQY